MKDEQIYLKSGQILILFFFSLSSYLAKGIVEKLEVINKKWVRVKLMPGNQVEGAVSICALKGVEWLIQ